MNIQELQKIMAQLRSPNGCPWDREQTPQTLKRFLIEESYELLEAIDKNNVEDIKEELGDVLLQVVFHSQIAEEENKFTLNDVIDGICKKLIVRHPHVFDTNNLEINTARDVEIQWEKIKQKDYQKKATRESVVDGVPTAMPSTLQAVRITEKASRVGFDWNNPKDVLNKLDEELQELKEAFEHGNPKEIKHEMGDMFFALSNLARHQQLDPEEVHNSCIQRFKTRFKKMEELAKLENKTLNDYTLEQQEELWQKAKKLLKDFE